MTTSKNGENMIEVEDLYKAFEGNEVLTGVTCQIPTGKISVVMGPSGTGKSVLLRHVVGLLYPDKGDVRVAGKSVPNLTEEELSGLGATVAVLSRAVQPSGRWNCTTTGTFQLLRPASRSDV